MDIISGSSLATIHGKNVARIGGSCEHGGKLLQGIAWLTFELRQLSAVFHDIVHVAKSFSGL